MHDMGSSGKISCGAFDLCLFCKCSKTVTLTVVGALCWGQAPLLIFLHLGCFEFMYIIGSKVYCVILQSELWLVLTCILLFIVLFIVDMMLVNLGPFFI